MFLELREHSVFRKVGYSFLMSLLPHDKLEELIYVELKLHARGESKVNFTFGNSSYSSVYKQIVYINKVLNDRSYDLRIDGQLKGLSDAVVLD